MKHPKYISGCIFFLFFLHISVAVAHEEKQEEQKISTSVIHAGTLLDIPGATPKHNQTLVIHGGKITSVRTGYLSPQQLGLDSPEVNVFNLKDKFVLPGMIDAHVHITHRYGEKFRKPDAFRRRTVDSGYRQC